MTEVIVSKEINIPAAAAWENLSSFRGIEKYSPIERSETTGHGVGATRTCYLPDGAAIHEVLDRVEESSMEMVYKITEGPFPVSGYVSTIKVSPRGKSSCQITWGGEFECNKEVETEMIKLFEGFYHVIIESLENVIQNQN